MDTIPIRDARVVLKARAVLAQHGLDDGLSVSDACRQLRERKVAEMGVRRYLYDILGALANRPADRGVTLWYGDEPFSLNGPNGRGRVSVVDLLVGLAGADGRGLPDRIEFEQGRIFCI